MFSARLFLAVSMLDPNFALIVKKPDNVPIVAMLFLVGFFIWLAMYAGPRERRADRQGRAAERGPNGENEKTWVWPDLVYTELLCMVIGMIVLVAWGMAFQAPIEEPANPARTPNPSKAPWYFLGLQEMLVYYDPWLAGVVFPSLIIVGLMAIPYIDTEPEGERLLHLQGAQGRDHDLPVRLPDPVGAPGGPRHVPARAELELLRTLRVLGRPQARWPSTTSTCRSSSGSSGRVIGLPKNMLLREIPGILASLFYIVVLPGLLARTWLKKYFEKLGPWRYGVFVMLLLLQIALPIKMFAALDVQPEVHRRDAGDLLQHLTWPSPSLAATPRWPAGRRS